MTKQEAYTGENSTFRNMAQPVDSMGVYNNKSSGTQEAKDSCSSFMRVEAAINKDLADQPLEQEQSRLIDDLSRAQA